MATSSSEHVEVAPDNALLPLPDSPVPDAITSGVADGHQDITTIPTIQQVRASKNQAITHTDDCLDNINWTVWWHRLMLMLQICGVQDYVTRNIWHPDPALDPKEARNWNFNDTYSKVLISNSITTTQMVHISQSCMSQESWSNLEAVHDAKSHQTTIGIICNLYCTSAEEGNNISDHLNKLKRYWERINLIANSDFKISDN